VIQQRISKMKVKLKSKHSEKLLKYSQPQMFNQINKNN
jgi:hypothetical protein